MKARLAAYKKNERKINRLTGENDAVDDASSLASTLSFWVA
jgi:hypothetical protein